MKRLDGNRRDQAAEWFSAQRRGAMSAEERGQFESWRTERENQAALEGMHALWGELSGLKDLAQEPPPRRRSSWPLALAAGLLAAVVGGTWWWQLELPGRAPTYTVQTAIGEQRSAVLPDGSRVELSVVTHLDYRRDSGRRDVRLLEGEALFFVRHDASHPFIVRAGNYEVRAVGTAFDVRSRDGRVQVAMLRGVVSVRAIAGPEAGRVLTQLTQGQEISLPESPPRLIQIERIPVQAVAQWRQGTMSYEDVPVGQIVEDMNRFFARPLHVPDPTLARRRVTLRLQVRDRQQTLETLSALLGAKIRTGRDADTLVEP